jgi:hypothetical protein
MPISKGVTTTLLHVGVVAAKCAFAQKCIKAEIYFPSIRLGIVEGKDPFYQTLKHSQAQARAAEWEAAGHRVTVYFQMEDGMPAVMHNGMKITAPDFW